MSSLKRLRITIRVAWRDLECRVQANPEWWSGFAWGLITATFLGTAVKLGFHLVGKFLAYSR